MLKVDFYCSVVTHYTKMLSIFVHYKSHIFGKCENMTCKTSNLLQQQRFSPFLTLYLLGEKLECLLKAACQTPNLSKMLLQTLTTPCLLSLDVRNGQILGFMSFYIIYESVNENINFF